MLSSIRIIVGLLLAMSVVCFAEPKEGGRGGACAQDIEKFCKESKGPGGGPWRCLKEHEKELSEACRKEQQERRERMEKTREACAGDIKTHCSSAGEDPRAAMRCLREAKGLSPGCQAKIDEMPKREGKHP